MFIINLIFFEVTFPTAPHRGVHCQGFTQNQLRPEEPH